MAVPFKPFVVISQSLDGKDLTITDQSNFDTNTDGVASGDINPYGVAVFDKNDQQLDSFVLDYPTGAWQITKDGFYRFHLDYVKGGTHYTADVTFLSTQFYDIVARKVGGFTGCGCGCKNQACAPAAKAMANRNNAISSFIAGDAVNAQQGMDDANTLILQALKSC